MSITIEQWNALGNAMKHYRNLGLAGEGLADDVGAICLHALKSAGLNAHKLETVSNNGVWYYNDNNVLDMVCFDTMIAILQSGSMPSLEGIE